MSPAVHVREDNLIALDTVCRPAARNPVPGPAARSENRCRSVRDVCLSHCCAILFTLPLDALRAVRSPYIAEATLRSARDPTSRGARDHPAHELSHPVHERLVHAGRRDHLLPTVFVHQPTVERGLAPASVRRPRNQIHVELHLRDMGIRLLVRSSRRISSPCLRGRLRSGPACRVSPARSSGSRS